jgi:hypothetical protein
MSTQKFKEISKNRIYDEGNVGDLQFTQLVIVTGYLQRPFEEHSCLREYPRLR